MNNRKRELIEHLVRSIDYTKERILYWERLRTRESYDIFVRLNENGGNGRRSIYNSPCSQRRLLYQGEFILLDGRNARAYRENHKLALNY